MPALPYDPSYRAEWIEKIQLWLILGILFFIPSSPAAPNLLGVALILVWLWEGRFAEKLQTLKVQPIFWAFLAYLLIYPLSLLWSDNQAWGEHIVERHMIYLMIPFLLTAIRYKHIPLYLGAFIAGITLTEIVSYLVWFELIHIEGVAPSNPTPFYHHVEYNPMLAWAIYLLMFGLFFQKRSLGLKLIVSLFIVTMTVNMFITGGRGGQLTYFIVVGLVFLQFFAFRGQLIKGIVFGGLFMSSVFFVAYQTSDLFQKRVDLAVHEVSNYSPNAHGSVSYRLHMYVNTAKLAFDRPSQEILFGSGVGDYPEDYTEYVGERAPFKMAANKEGHSHPHSQYFYELGALGLLGLSVFLSMFVAAIRRSWLLSDEYTYHRWAFLVFMGAIMVTDSLLLAHPTGLLFIVFSAVLYAAYPDRKESSIGSTS